jgi:hypothetical protein
MENNQKRPLTPQEVEKFYKTFPITSICRADLQEALKMSEEDVLRIDDVDMEEIAEKMADAYCDNVFWIDLPIVAESVLEGREA